MVDFNKLLAEARARKISGTPTPVHIDRASDLDHTPLTFGKYRGKTPNDVSESDPRYIVWLYETVKDRDTCSQLLYKECKGDPELSKLRAILDDLPDDDIPF